jgi:hypothetical protein
MFIGARLKRLTRPSVWPAFWAAVETSDSITQDRSDGMEINSTFVLDSRMFR